MTINLIRYVVMNRLGMLAKLFLATICTSSLLCALALAAEDMQPERYGTPVTPGTKKTARGNNSMLGVVQERINNLTALAKLTNERLKELEHRQAGYSGDSSTEFYQDERIRKLEKRVEELEQHIRLIESFRR